MKKRSHLIKKNFVLFAFNSFAMVLLGFGYQNCSKTSFGEISEEAKLTKLSESVLPDGPTNPDEAISIDIVPGTSDDDVKIERTCSTSSSTSNNANVAIASKLTLQIQSVASNYLSKAAARTAQILCQDTDTKALRNEVFSGKLSFSRCVKSNETAIDIFDKSQRAINKKNTTVYAVLVNENNEVLNMEIRLEIVGGAILHKPLDAATIQVLTDYNPKIKKSDPYFTTADLKDAAIAHCDRFASPLFVDMRNLFEDTGVFELTSRHHGVWFDILGRRASPLAHTPERISWFKKNNGYGLIALPDRLGNVNGIDQLFGDNTFGPDGQFASNGYLALAKYDSNHNNIIDSEDLIFSDLRVWFDVDQNGKASAAELLSLDEAGIAVIYLRYDKNFSEQDQYGNKIQYKSVIKLKDGSLRLIFDIWFKLN